MHQLGLIRLQERVGGLGLLLPILALSAGLHLYRLDALGDANLYYTAAVYSMLQSVSNFFFVAAEPGGSVSVDKPPLGLWIEALSALLFGVNGVAVILPNVLAGLASTAIVFGMVRRRSGLGAGLLAAMVMAVTPSSLAAERNNTMDGMLTLCLVFGAWAFLRASETGQGRFLWFGAAFIGLGFNVKMLQAYLVLPACYAVYLLTGTEGWNRKLLKLGATTLVILAFSLAWAAAVDLTPAEERPYVGGSTDNTVMELIVGHNGLSRIFGPGRDAQPASSVAGPGPVGARPGIRRPGSDGPLPPGASGAPPQPGGAGGAGPGGPQETGQPGFFRFLTAPLSNEVSWLLPFALLALGALVLEERFTWPLGPGHRPLVLWGGWLLTCLVFFSVARFFHPYYLVMVGPPLAVLVASGAAVLARRLNAGSRAASIAFIGGAGATVGYQWFNAAQFGVTGFWVPLGFLATACGAIVLVVRRTSRASQIGVSMLGFGMLLAPLAWSVLTVLHPTSRGVPTAYAGDDRATPPFGPALLANPRLIEFLEGNTEGVRYLLAVPSAMMGAPLVLATGRPVLYMGGFNGVDPVVTEADVAALVKDQWLRYVFLGPSPGQTRADVRGWVISHCAAVFVPLQAGAGSAQRTPDLNRAPGARLQPSPGGQPRDGPGPGSNAAPIYDCRG